VAAGNIGISYAYMTDITTEENRSKGMGLLGAAFGLGFIVGPAIGGILAGPDVATADYFTPAIVAAALSSVACLGIFVWLPESLKPDVRARLAQQKQVPLLQQISTVMSRRVLVMFVAIGFFFVSAWALLEAIMGFWAQAEFNYGPTHVGYLLVWMGTISVFIQGVLIGPLTRRFGEQNLLMTAIAISLIGFSFLATATTLFALLASTAVLSLSSGLFNPSVTSLVSKEASERDRGVVLGVYQGAGSMARVIGPAFAGPVFVWLGASVPFLMAAGLMVPCLFLMQRVIQRKRLAESTPG
jgi:DHA1 family tetracycline resistance protein-like MFS transporter